MVPGEGLEPSKPEGRRILSPLRLPFRHPGTGALRKTRTQHQGRPRAGSSKVAVEATIGFEPMMGVLQTPALTTWLRRLNIRAYGPAGLSLVPRRGFEPLRPKARPPQDRVSTNFTTSAVIYVWQEWRDSNPRPAVLETAALPTELHSSACGEYNNETPKASNGRRVMALAFLCGFCQIDRYCDLIAISASASGSTNGSPSTSITTRRSLPVKRNGGR